MGAAQLVILGLGLVSLGLSFWAIRADAALSWKFVVPEVVAPEGEPVFDTVFDYTADIGQAHSPGILVREEGFTIMWFEGSEEAQADVDIHYTGFERDAEGWLRGTTGLLVTRGGLAKVMEPGQIVVTLGNTIENEAVRDGLYATVASVGGWAMASVVDVRAPGGRAVRGRKLNLSPVLGRSNLVKSPMVAYQDGSFGLPAYFEMGSTFGVLVRLDRQGRVRDTRRMNGFGKPIQPMVVPLSESRAVAFLRDFDPSRKLLVSRTEDGGQSWSRVEPMEVENPSSPVAALGLGDGRILLAVNDDGDRPEVLRLVLSEDEGASWRVLRAFEGEGALRYPMLRRLTTGEIVLAYSKGTKRGVVAHVFNQAWVAAQ
ncbi:exo-alpha-sialidase [Roseovarius indicus]|uniref:exo-alpha-sialidase n=1 Tax=Roseovarius indicus TaxID=540747 RepID=UPI0032ED94EF